LSRRVGLVEKRIQAFALCLAEDKSYFENQMDMQVRIRTTGEKAGGLCSSPSILLCTSVTAVAAGMEEVSVIALVLIKR